MEIERGTLPPPPGLIRALAAGFESVANSIAVIALPVIIDLYLWFGPHLRLQTITRPWLNALPDLYSNMFSLADLETLRLFWGDIFSRFNIFASLRTFPIGLSSLLASEAPLLTPLGSPLIFEAGSFLEVLVWLVILALVGWLIGALYFYWVSRITLRPEALPIWRAIGQTVLLSFAWLIILVSAGLPLFMLFSITMLISPALAQVLVFLFSLALLWLVVPLYFSAHGIFTYKLGAISAILNSLRMVRFTLPSTFLFLALLAVISQGLRILWTSPAQNSWWLLVGILGHAFTSTALLAASFIYYRDVNNWLKVVFEQLKKRAVPVKN